MLILPKKDLRYTRMYIERNPVLYSRYLLKLLTIAIRDDLDGIKVFQIKDTDTEGSIRRKDYIDALDTAIRHFVKYEEYELATEAQKLIITFSVNNLLRDINKTTE